MERKRRWRVGSSRESNRDRMALREGVELIDRGKTTKHDVQYQLEFKVSHNLFYSSTTTKMNARGKEKRKK